MKLGAANQNKIIRTDLLGTRFVKGKSDFEIGAKRIETPIPGRSSHPSRDAAKYDATEKVTTL
jgi:hypothetical protein